jgi:hypothetical protein
MENSGQTSAEFNNLIQKVYKQSVAAYAGDSRIIASMGLRATIEAVCTHLSISGTSLEKRIDSLFKNGHISSSDKKRLHGIRFLGNDAAHDIREPGTNEFRIALEIIEHLISSVFILNQRAQGLLDTTIETFTEFLPVLEGCARGLETDTSVTLAGLLGKHRRRLGIEFPQLETELIAKINPPSRRSLHHRRPLLQLASISARTAPACCRWGSRLAPAAFLHRRRGQRLGHFLLHAVDDVHRRAGGGQQAEPGAGLEALGAAGLFDRGHVGQRGRGWRW